MPIYAIVIIIVLAVIIALICGYLFAKYNPKLSHKKLKKNDKNFIIEFHNDGNETPYLVKKNLDGSLSNNDFRVVCCADLHLATDEYIFGLTVLERLIDKTNPDLVILLGDNACGRDDNFIEKKIIEFFERKKIYYAFILGNHDSEYLITKEMNTLQNVDAKIYSEIQKKYRTLKFNYLSDSKYCVGRLGDANLFGAGNYSVNIKNANGLIKTLYFFDSGDYAYGVRRTDIGTEKRCYDHIHDNQLEWYKNEVKKNDVESLAFFHIPLKEHCDAQKRSLYPGLYFLRRFGNNYEKPCCSNLNDDKTFATFKELNSTKVVVVGHDHKNDSCTKYKGIKLMYSQGLQYDGAYNRRKKAGKLFRFLYKIGIKCYVEGVSVFDLNKNKIKITPVYAEKEKVFYGLEKYYKKAWLEGHFKQK